MTGAKQRVRAVSVIIEAGARSKGTGSHRGKLNRSSVGARVRVARLMEKESGGPVLKGPKGGRGHGAYSQCEEGAQSQSRGREWRSGTTTIEDVRREGRTKWYGWSEKDNVGAKAVV